MKSCIDLKERFGQQYQVTYEESYEADRGRRARGHDPWLLIMPCRFGHIYPQGGELLAASTNHRGPVANQLSSLPCVSMLQDGDDGVSIVFHVDDFAEVARLMKPRKRRRLSSEKRAEQSERLRKYRFLPATHDARSDRQLDGTTVRGPIATIPRRSVMLP
jgi:hypothetical protein